MSAPIRIMAIRVKSGNVYRFKFNRDGEANQPFSYPHSYTSTKNGREFTTGAGASTFEGAMAEAIADIDNHGEEE